MLVCAYVSSPECRTELQSKETYEFYVNVTKLIRKYANQSNVFQMFDAYETQHILVTTVFYTKIRMSKSYVIIKHFCTVHVRNSKL